MITKLQSHGRASVAFEFSNGARLSVVWREMTYSDNHDAFDRAPEGGMLESKTFEAMITDGEEQLIEAFESKYEANPAGYIEAAKLPEVIDFVDKYEPKNDPAVYEIELEDWKRVKVYKSQQAWFDKEVLPKLKEKK